MGHLDDYLDTKTWVKELGRGHYSYALAGRGKDYVIKLSKFKERKEEDPWWIWARHLAKDQGPMTNSLLPAVKAVETLPDGVHVAFVERLEEDRREMLSRFNEAERAYTKAIPDYLYSTVSTTTRYVLGQMARDAAGLGRFEEISRGKLTLQQAMDAVLPPLGIKNGEFAAAWRDIGKIEGLDATKTDMLGGNFAFRNNGQIVMTDPLG